VGIDLSGFGRRPSESTGVHEDLFARALVLSNDDADIALVTTDLIGLDLELCEIITSGVTEQIGIPAGQIMLSSTHTHSGPAALNLRGLGNPDPVYLQAMCQKVIDAVVEAWQTREPARLGWGRCAAEMGMNRREKTETGTHLGRNPGGVDLPYVDVLRVDRADGAIMALWFAHAAHAVVFGQQNTLISSDWPGAAVRVTAKRLGGDPVLMVSQGCCGDINPPIVGGTPDDVERLGAIVGRAAADAAENISTTGSPHLESVVSIIDLPQTSPPSRSEAQKELSRQQADRDAVYEKSESRLDRLFADGLVEWAEEVAAVADDPGPFTTPFTEQTFAIGDGAVVGLSGEVFGAYTVEIEARSEFEQTAVIAYTNGCVGYVPTVEAFDEGGYEVDNAFRYYGTLNLTSDAWELITSYATRQLEMVNS
jgi:hypothetical protein